MEQEKRNLNQMKEKLNEDFLRITPDALDALHDMITDENINPLARVQAIGLILERGLGKPEETIRLQNDKEDFEEAIERLDVILEKAKGKDRKSRAGREKVPLKKSSPRNQTGGG